MEENKWTVWKRADYIRRACVFMNDSPRTWSGSFLLVHLWALIIYLPAAICGTPDDNPSDFPAQHAPCSPSLASRPHGPPRNDPPHVSVAPRPSSIQHPPHRPYL
ncbi:hypothetical protein AcW1_001203 [Taiwanofungus camphoratus]|nr:hypothetical protein AcW2_000287 [Antrodia cinnamomea]KAI0937146.1 hypothetical protein AcV5_005115 [Antrodia cinnamomea]KAI0962360.1 hypothetical protein AcV7_001221 [Antrodia cinnamomea]KAI0964367.1 hypothetical protein AcW1_001203 [Antrodia cinnamomea]